MRPKTIVLLAVAVVCGLGASFAVSKLMSKQLFSRPNEEATVEVWVAKPDDGIKQGTRIDKPEDFFERKRMPEDQVGKTAMPAKNPDEQLKNKFLTRSLSKGQFVTPKDFDEKGLGLTPPPGLQALGMKASAEVIAGGFVLPNSRVDVIWTTEDPKRPGRYVSQIKLQNILVLAVDHVTERQAEAKGQNVVSPSTVTLAVTDDEAKRLGFLQAKGKLWLALRNPEDQKPNWKTKGADSPQDPECENKDPAPQQEVFEVAVARDYLPARTRLEASQFVTKRFPKAVKDALTMDEIRKGDKYLKQPLSAGEFVSRTLDLNDGTPAKEEPIVSEPRKGTDGGEKAPEKDPGPKVIIINIPSNP
jgi:pilus assembly protein CpaB